VLAGGSAQKARRGADGEAVQEQGGERGGVAAAPRRCSR